MHIHPQHTHIYSVTTTNKHHLLTFVFCIHVKQYFPFVLSVWLELCSLKILLRTDFEIMFVKMFCASPQFKISHAYYGSLGHNNDRVSLQRLISLNTSVLCRTLNKLQTKKAARHPEPIHHDRKNPCIDRTYYTLHYKSAQPSANCCSLLHIEKLYRIASR